DDIGVGDREVGYMLGQYKRIQNDFTGVLTGEGKHWGGSFIRPEATGYGLLYFVECIFENIDEKIAGKTIAISGAGNVAYYAAEKAINLGAKVISLSTSSGTLHGPEVLTLEKLASVSTLGRELVKYPQKCKAASFYADTKP